MLSPQCHEVVERACHASVVDRCHTVTEVAQECRPASLAAALTHGHGQGHFVAPVQECVGVPVPKQVCHQEPVEVRNIESRNTGTLTFRRQVFL